MQFKQFFVFIVALSLAFGSVLSMAMPVQKGKKLHKHSKVQNSQLHHRNHIAHKRATTAIVRSPHRTITPHLKKQITTVTHHKQKPVTLHRAAIKSPAITAIVPAPVAQNPIDVLIDKTAQQVKQEASKRVAP